jgi:hypothetical protein
MATKSVCVPFCCVPGFSIVKLPEGLTLNLPEVRLATTLPAVVRYGSGFPSMVESAKEPGDSSSTGSVEPQAPAIARQNTAMARRTWAL